MDYLKYFNNNKYNLKECNCWTFVQDVFEQEEGHRLPNSPVFDSLKEWGAYIQSNVKYNVLEKAHKGCLIHTTTSIHEHVGYAINEKEYIHRKEIGILISDIPKNAIICEVLHD